MTLLQVTGITFGNIGTAGYKVQWTAPSGYTSFISGYTVSWVPTSAGSPKDTGTSAYTDLTGLTPGRKYTVTITTRHTTASGETKTTSVYKEQSTSKCSVTFCAQLVDIHR